MIKQQYDIIGKDYVEKINPTKKYALSPTLVSLTGNIQGKKLLDLTCGEKTFDEVQKQLGLVESQSTGNVVAPSPKQRMILPPRQ